MSDREVLYDVVFRELHEKHITEALMATHIVDCLLAAGVSLSDKQDADVTMIAKPRSFRRPIIIPHSSSRKQVKLGLSLILAGALLAEVSQYGREIAGGVPHHRNLVTVARRFPNAPQFGATLTCVDMSRDACQRALRHGMDGTL